MSFTAVWSWEEASELIEKDLARVTALIERHPEAAQWE